MRIKRGDRGSTDRRECTQPGGKVSRRGVAIAILGKNRTDLYEHYVDQGVDPLTLRGVQDLDGKPRKKVLRALKR